MNILSQLQALLGYLWYSRCKASTERGGKENFKESAM